MRINDRHGGRRAGAGRKHLTPGEPTVQVRVAMGLSLRRQLRQLASLRGMSEAEYVRRLVANAALSVPSDKGEA